MNVFFLSEKAEVFIVVSPAPSWWWLLSKQSTRAGWATENSLEATSKENRDWVANWNLQGKAGYKCQGRNSEAETDQGGDSPQEHRPSTPDIRAGVEFPYDPCSMFAVRKEKGSNPNFCPVRSDQRLDLQPSRRQVISCPFSQFDFVTRAKTTWWSHHKNWNSLRNGKH